ncbi:hypothetical protein AQZ50_06805 [Novosphingobium sp. Fuku2-ISO-50]|nr:hypothetical protein AQZ50_06805 [Novosphingobium sp. Fuku2-ISO-50]
MMMRRALALFALLIATLGVTAQAREVSTRTWTDAAGVVWTETTTVETENDGADRLVGSAAPAMPGIARFGPFVVLDGRHAALVDATDGASPARFAAMLRAYPGIQVLEMVDCPGTLDDNANLRLGRMIRARAIATEVPPGGSVRSGAVELFLAGADRHAAPDADFGVHAWEDDAGRGPGDYPANAPVNRAYVDYYRAMGMSEAQAAAFYALTNSAPNARVRWLHTSDIARFVAID